MENMKKKIHHGMLPALTAVFFLLAISCPATANAQMGWLQKGKDLLGGLTTSGTAATALSKDEIAAGLKDALKVGSETVVSQLGKTDGFNADPKIHIPLPEKLSQVRSVLQKIGRAGMMDDLELKLNRAAEVATPKAKQLFLDSIQAMSLDDVMEIYQGPEDAATRYFQGKMSGPLAEEMRPVVDQSLQQVGAIQSYDAVMGQYRSFPFVPDVKADLTGYVVDRGMAGIFHYLAEEEAAIRANPAKRTTELLQKVFGSGS